MTHNNHFFRNKSVSLKYFFQFGTAALGIVLITGCSTKTQAPEEIASTAATSAEDSVSVAGENPNVSNSTGQKSANESTPSKAVAKTPSNPAKKTQIAKAIAWESTFEMALQKARASRKPIMVDFFATWCGPCHFLADRVYVAPPVVQESGNFISVQVDVDKRQDLMEKFQIASMPTIVFFDSMGKEVSRQSGVPGDEDTAIQFVVDIMRDARKQAAGTSA